MRTILIILRKEFKQIFRNRVMLPIIFVIPIVQLLVLVHAATFEMKNIKMLIVDADNSSSSRTLVSKFQGSPFFDIVDYPLSVEEAESEMDANKADLILHIPAHFERDLLHNNQVKLQLLLNAINGQAAGIAQGYTQSIIRSYNVALVLQWQKHVYQAPQPVKQIELNYQFWYNPELNYKTFMVPGILVLLITIIGMFLSGLNLVREKEIGTIEQLNVSPIRKHQFIIGKLVPFWVIALFELALGLLVGKLLFDIPIVGSLPLLFGMGAVYLLVVLAVGLLVSTLVDTQQQSMFISWFIAIIFILMSGLFTSVESMPEWAQWFNKLNPIAYFIQITRMILLKGSGFTDLAKEFYSLTGLGVILLGSAIMRYRKTN